MVGNVRENPKAFWKYISCQKKDTQGIPPLKTKNGHLAESDKEKAQVFNSQFTGVFTKFTVDAVPFLKRKFPQMDNIKVTVLGVTKLLKGLNPSKASGPEKNHAKVLKELSEALGRVFAHIFQQSIDYGRIPEDWSKANICTLYIKGHSALPSDYRPVSLTCICCKLLEHIVCRSILDHVDRYSVLTDKQHAFRKHHSCETQLSHVVDEWSKCLDREQVDIFIMDQEKSLDTPHMNF